MIQLNLHEVTCLIKHVDRGSNFSSFLLFLAPFWHVYSAGAIDTIRPFQESRTMILRPVIWCLVNVSRFIYRPMKGKHLDLKLLTYLKRIKPQVREEKQNRLSIWRCETVNWNSQTSPEPLRLPWVLKLMCSYARALRPLNLGKGSVIVQTWYFQISVCLWISGRYTVKLVSCFLRYLGSRLGPLASRADISQTFDGERANCGNRGDGTWGFGKVHRLPFVTCPLSLLEDQHLLFISLRQQSKMLTVSLQPGNAGDETPLLWSARV